MQVEVFSFLTSCIPYPCVEDCFYLLGPVFPLGCFCDEFYPFLVFDIDDSGVIFVVDSHVTDDDPCPFVSIDERVLGYNVIKHVGGFLCRGFINFFTAECLICTVDAGEK